MPKRKHTTPPPPNPIIQFGYVERRSLNLAIRTAPLTSSCSHTRRTRQPSALRILFTLLSRSLLPCSLFFQNAALLAGMFPHFGQQCQKQPSMKTARRSRLKVKSGRPSNGRCRRQPDMWCLRSREANRSSVPLLFRDRIRDMTSDLFRGVKTSAISWEILCCRQFVLYTRQIGQRGSILLRGVEGLNDLSREPRDEGHDDGVAELLIGLGI